MTEPFLARPQFPVHALEVPVQGYSPEPADSCSTKEKSGLQIERSENSGYALHFHNSFFHGGKVGYKEGDTTQSAMIPFVFVVVAGVDRRDSALLLFFIACELLSQSFIFPKKYPS
jgi:hypothetical protein